MVLHDVPLDMVSYGELVMAVGLTVDYVIHIVHAIANIEIKENDIEIDYYTRLTIAFADIGTGVAKGGFTTFLGVLTLAFSGSAAFRSFFIMFGGIICISIVHGFLFIPAILGEFKCFYSNQKQQE